MEISSLCLCYLHPNCEYCLLLFSIYCTIIYLIVIHSILTSYPALRLRNIRTSTTITSKFSLFALSEICFVNCILLTYRKVWSSQVAILLNSTYQTYCLVRWNFVALVTRRENYFFTRYWTLPILWSRLYVILQSINSAETLVCHAIQNSDHQTGWSHSYEYRSLFTCYNQYMKNQFTSHVFRKILIRSECSFPRWSYYFIYTLHKHYF